LGKAQYWKGQRLTGLEMDNETSKIEERISLAEHKVLVVALSAGT